MAEVISMTVKQGPKSTGKLFGFRFASGKGSKGKIEVGKEEQKIRLDNAHARKIHLGKLIEGYASSGLLVITEREEAKESKGTKGSDAP